MPLDSKAFARLLALLDADQDRAAEQYLSLRSRLVLVFTRKGCQPAEDLADEAIDRIARKAETEEIRDIASYAFGVASMIALEHYRNNPRTRSLNAGGAADDSLTADRSPQDTLVEKLSHEKEMECLRKCLRRLTPAERELIISYYGEPGSLNKEVRRQLAEKEGLSAKALRDKATWIRAKLRVWVQECLRLRQARPTDPICGADLIGAAHGEQSGER